MEKTHGYIDIQGPGHGRFEMSIQNDRPEEHFVSRFIDGFVRLDEHGVALVDVFQFGRVCELQASEASRRQVVRSGTQIADLKRMPPSTAATIYDNIFPEDPKYFPYEKWKFIFKLQKHLKASVTADELSQFRFPTVKTVN